MPFASNFLLLARRVSHAAPLLLATLLSAPAGAEPADDSRWSFSWGWNRETYSTSDIHFWGRDHDFTLSNVHAHDKQAPADIGNVVQTYINPGRITIPQTNVRVAYQWHADDALAINLDHMKYVATTNQSVPISGTIHGQTQSGLQVFSPDFMAYEHTDGLNILTLEYERQWMVSPFGPSQPVRLFGLGGAGVVIPKTNVTLSVMGQKRNDEFHLAGGSAHVGLGAELDFLQDFFVRFTTKAGYVDLPDVWTSARRDHASQHFTYTEYLLTFGYRL